MLDGIQTAKFLKRKVLMRYVRGLERLDPQFARHILSAQREFFLAGKSFFETEAAHAEKAMDKMTRKMERDHSS